MTRLLGYVELKNNEQLEEVLNKAGYSLDLHNHEFKYFNADALWAEAEDEFSSGNETAECRIDGLDYVLIQK